MGIDSSVHVLVDAAHVELDLAVAILHERGPASELPTQLEPAGPVCAVDLPLVQQASVVVHSSQVNEVAVIHGRPHRTRITGRVEWHLELVGRRPRDEGHQSSAHGKKRCLTLATKSWRG
eukprot:scaffold93785_cov69-Phaeocystis_antarctica.AAC.2